jgi:hypothetical protein
MAFDKYGTVAASPYIPTDQQLEGPQGLTFRTPALSEPMRLTGPLALHLVAASSARETDWHAKVADVAPDGSETLITDGALRASHRELDPRKSTPVRPYHPSMNPTPIEPGRFYKYAIEIWPTAYELAAGHRLQVRLTSSDMPTHMAGEVEFSRSQPAQTRIDLNPPATNTVRFASSYLLATVDSAKSGGCSRALRGTPGDDRLRGDGRSERLMGGPGSDRISGGGGDDCIAGGAGEDDVAGGSGDDSIFIDKGGADRVRCGPGLDRVRVDRADRIAPDCERVRRRGDRG